MFETRHYLCSAKPDIERSARGARGHWNVESMHRLLDVEFKDDLSAKIDGLPFGSAPLPAAHFQNSLRRLRYLLKVFGDMRGTAVTMLFLAGCSEAEIATITGHSLKNVRSISATSTATRAWRTPGSTSSTR